MENITTFNLNLVDKYDKIFVLVSGGIDSTYLYELFKTKFGNKIYPVNCFNPLESNNTLKRISKDKNFIQIKPTKETNYNEIIEKAFINLPKSFAMLTYGKKVYGCCYKIKHSAFKKHKMFKEENTVVIDGIKYSDGRQRMFWLHSLFDGKTRAKGTKILNAPTFFHIHKGRQNYCYPFRDYKEKEFPKEILDELREKYPKLNHSGCYKCPVLIRMEKKVRKTNDKFDMKRLELSIKFAKKLDVYKNYSKIIIEIKQLIKNIDKKINNTIDIEEIKKYKKQIIKLKIKEEKYNKLIEVK